MAAHRHKWFAQTLQVSLRHRKRRTELIRKIEVSQDFKHLKTIQNFDHLPQRCPHLRHSSGAFCCFKDVMDTSNTTQVFSPTNYGHWRESYDDCYWCHCSCQQDLQWPCSPPPARKQKQTKIKEITFQNQIANPIVKSLSITPFRSISLFSPKFTRKPLLWWIAHVARANVERLRLGGHTYWC